MVSGNRTVLGRRSGTPTVIRRVTQMTKGKNPVPKVAWDRKARIKMERIKARTPRVCTYHACPWGLVINAGTEYAMVTDMEQRKRLGHLYVPDPKPFHFGCVPPEARPLVRFFRDD